MPTQIDHVVIAVEDLDEAMRSFSDLGFNVIEGGEHSFRKSRNLLITFQDGSYIEIIAFLEDGPRDDPWWQLLQQGEGWVDWCLYAESIDPILARDIPGAKGPVDGGRITPDGDQIQWRTVRIPVRESVKLPFVIEDITARDLRIPEGNASIHPNGVTGIQRVTTLVRDLKNASEQLAILLDRSSERSSNLRQEFALNHQVLELFAPETRDEVNVDFLAARGPLPYEVTFVVDSDSAPEREWPSIVHGARISFVQH